jgi:hydroxymethylbilane synthase
MGGAMTAKPPKMTAGMITTRTGMAAEIVGVTTLGDVSLSQLVQLGGTGVFVSALREALLAGEVDLAVHSARDLPAGAAAGIVLGAVPTRDDPRDALRMQAAVITTDGRRALRAHGAASRADARQLGRDLAEQLLGARASDLIGAHPDGLHSPVGYGNANR